MMDETISLVNGETDILTPCSQSQFLVSLPGSLRMSVLEGNIAEFQGSSSMSMNSDKLGDYKLYINFSNIVKSFWKELLKH